MLWALSRLLWTAKHQRNNRTALLQLKQQHAQKVQVAFQELYRSAGDRLLEKLHGGSMSLRDSQAVAMAYANASQVNKIEKKILHYTDSVYVWTS
jgi:hypothetical protein